MCCCYLRLEEEEEEEEDAASNRRVRRVHHTAQSDEAAGQLVQQELARDGLCRQRRALLAAHQPAEHIRRVQVARGHRERAHHGQAQVEAGRHGRLQLGRVQLPQGRRVHASHRARRDRLPVHEQESHDWRAHQLRRALAQGARSIHARLRAPHEGGGGRLPAAASQVLYARRARRHEERRHQGAHAAAQSHDGHGSFVRHRHHCHSPQPTVDNDSSQHFLVFFLLFCANAISRDDSGGQYRQSSQRIDAQSCGHVATVRPLSGGACLQALERARLRREPLERAALCRLEAARHSARRGLERGLRRRRRRLLLCRRGEHSRRR